MADAASLLTIGDVAERTGVSAATLRYYEELGLVAPAGRRGLTRLYESPAIVERLEIIRLAGVIGFTLEETRVLLARARDRRAFEPLAQRKLEALEERRRDLRTATQLLRHAIACDCADMAECLAASSAVPDLLRSGRRSARRRRGERTASRD